MDSAFRYAGIAAALLLAGCADLAWEKPRECMQQKGFALVKRQ